MTLTWIVGLDGSDGSAAALRWAAEFAGRRGERIRPVAAWHLPFPMWLGSAHRVVEVDRAGISAEITLRADAVVADMPGEMRIDEPSVVEGHPARILCKMSAADRPVVVGRRGVGDLQHRVLGSVSDYVATHANGSVVVVPEAWESAPIERLVVGFDGSDESVLALEWALDVVDDDTPVELLVALDVVPWQRPEIVAERHPEVLEAARNRINEAADSVDVAGRSRRHFVTAGPRHALGDFLGAADLVVVGRRGLGGVARTMLGSVSSWLIHQSICPVAVIHDDS